MKATALTKKTILNMVICCTLQRCNQSILLQLTFFPAHPRMGKLAIVLLITNTTLIWQMQLVTNFFQVHLDKNFLLAN